MRTPQCTTHEMKDTGLQHRSWGARSRTRCLTLCAVRFPSTEALAHAAYFRRHASPQRRQGAPALWEFAAPIKPAPVHAVLPENHSARAIRTVKLTSRPGLGSSRSMQVLRLRRRRLQIWRLDGRFPWSRAGPGDATVRRALLRRRLPGVRLVDIAGAGTRRAHILCRLNVVDGRRILLRPRLLGRPGSCRLQRYILFHHLRHKNSQPPRHTTASHTRQPQEIAAGQLQIHCRRHECD